MARESVTALDTKSATISNTALGIAAFAFSAGHLLEAGGMHISCRSAGVMMTWSGVVPTASLGHLVAQDGWVEFHGNTNLNAIKLIREAAVDAVVTITLVR